MGDFWPGNIMVTINAEQTELTQIHILDWELAKPGLPGLDIGQFLAEMHLLRTFHPPCDYIASNIMTSFLESYYRKTPVDESLCRDAIVHVGAHLVTWTPRVPWGSTQKTKDMVEEGVKLLVDGYTGSLQTESIVGPLILAIKKR